MRKIPLVPITHPGSIVRGGWANETAQVEALGRVATWLREGFPPTPNMSEPPEGANLDPTPDDMLKWLEGLWEGNPHQGLTSQGVALDIENAGPHIRCIGMARIRDDAYLCVRFRKQGGDPYSYTIMCHRAKFVQSILSDPRIPKVMHFGQQHDVPHLERTGFTIEGFTHDTGVMMANTYHEMPRRLEFCALMFGCVPAWWKRTIKDTDEEEGK